ncbi:MAG TPA: amidohydrolase [Xanthobacteraceae bacterium]|nr:amidohydrolase [Xanthobacteraceae bacterium]
MLRLGASIVALLVLGTMSALAQTADKALINGKIITVDDRFTIGQAIAIRGQRVVKVGSNAEIERLTGPSTQIINLAGRTVIPGLIDNHSHWVRAAEHDELRFDGVTSRARALEMLAERVRAVPPGAWIVVLGGWSEEQFTDEPRGFSIEELDRLAPNNPVVLQAVYNHSYLNTVALVAAKIDASTPDPQGGRIEKDAGGKPIGVVRGAGGVAFIAARIPLENQEAWLANTRKLVAYLNSLGVTAWLDAGGRGMGAKHYEPYKHLADRGELDIRVFFTTIRQPATPAQVDAVINEIRELKPFQGTDYFDHVGWGESVFAPVTTQLLRVASNTKPEDLAQMRRLLLALAERGIYVNSHVEMSEAIDAFLNEYEAINKERPIKGLRWSFSHLDQVTEAQLERMKRLGMTAQIHSRPLIQGALMHKVHGDKAWDMPPFRRIQDSGIHWGLGSDATAVTTSNPFYTLSLAVTGRMIGGRQVNRQTITREEALIAHTRSNAHFLFQEGNLGSLAPGKYADLLVLDRDYLTVPADEIKDIKPLITMVGGKIVHDALPK